MSDALRTMSAEEFARRLKMMCEHPDSRFAFFLGAGCSASSGIPASAGLVRNHWLPRLRDLRAPRRRDLEAWAKEVLPAHDPQDAAAAYGPLMQELFLLPEERQREIESLCDGKFPGFGYAVLASLMTQSGGSFNVALTTNFDDLISDALYLFTSVRPLVAPHESLGTYLRPTRTRPLIVKLHGDHCLAPLNTPRSTDDLRRDVDKRIRSVIRDRGLIFMGYGGRDEGIARMLSELTEEALPLGVYWVGDQEPQGAIRPWLESRRAVWIQQRDFDEWMLLLRDVFGLPHPDSKRFDHVFLKYTGTYQSLSQRIGSLGENEPGVEALKEAVQRADATFPDWWAVELEAERLKGIDPAKADAVYQKGIEQFPNTAPLLNSYANFLRDYRKDNVRAEEQYQRALAADRGNPEVLQHYAFFLSRVRKDQERAEDLYQKALALDPNNPRLIATFAGFLARMRRDVKRAEEHYRRALAIDAADPYIQASHAGFLLAQGRDPEGLEALARVLSQSGLQETPNLALECWFYQLAHGPADARGPALGLLKKSIKAGRRRSGLLLAQNITRARHNGHPESPWLEKLAAVLNDEGPASLLDDWPAWKAA
ncbi:MAG TPA: SIR2 family protein [Candidatus Paceibacterota bacterium]|nr:SIR2 family protein [Verrucomicrobiota bacterium]HOX03309.1 SIR2 family protein [Verrucomicrobiota bacterium]HRZ46229.1 SIR2 family protein [Candidatus Paceibacterota bacterium]